MQLSRKGAAFIRLHEGFREKAYLDPVGVLTIGVGFTWKSEAFRNWWRAWKTGEFDKNSRMTKDEADDALQYLVTHEYGKAVDKFLTGTPVPQHVYDAMVSAVFNLGPGALRWKWAAAVKDGDYAVAAARLRKTGTTAKGKTLPGLVRRRKEEALLLEKGIYTGVFDAKANVEAVLKTPTAPSQEELQAAKRALARQSAAPVKAALPWWKRLFGLTK